MGFEHPASGQGNLELLKRFYSKYFNCIAGNKYSKEEKMNEKEINFRYI